jgi:hypothetical protein
MRAVLLGLFCTGCATWVPTREAYLSRKYEGDLMTVLAGLQDGDHIGRCAEVYAARRRCVSAGLELHCADDWTERSRGEWGCGITALDATEVRR